MFFKIKLNKTKHLSKSISIRDILNCMSLPWAETSSSLLAENIKFMHDFWITLYIYQVYTVWCLQCLHFFLVKDCSDWLFLHFTENMLYEERIMNTIIYSCMRWRLQKDDSAVFAWAELQRFSLFVLSQREKWLCNKFNFQLEYVFVHNRCFFQ